MTIGCITLDQSIKYKKDTCNIRIIDFGAVDATVKTLTLKNNGLENILYFPYFSRLLKVMLSGKVNMTVFPNFENVSHVHVLEDMTMLNAGLHTIAQRHLAVLRKLSLLDLGDNFIHPPFPDMDLNPGSQLTRLRLRGNPMDKLPVLLVIAHGLESLVHHQECTFLQALTTDAGLVHTCQKYVVGALSFRRFPGFLSFA